MIRVDRILRLTALILLTSGIVACNLSTSLEPETAEPATRPQRIVRPKVLTTIGTPIPETVR